MSRFSQAIGRVFSGGAAAFSRYPAAMFSALIVAVSSSILIYMDSPFDEKIFSNLILAFGGAAFWGMAVSVISERLRARRLWFIILNIVSMFGASGLFAYLYLSQTAGDLPTIVLARIIAGGLAAFIIFLLVISADAGRSDYNQSAFMVLKSFLIALLYTVVILLGLFFVAFTVQSLLYEDLSEKVYSYIATWSAFVGFAFFLGYFPLFRKGEQDSRLEIAQKHPAFIEILFTYVMIPILSILTIVLAIWAIQSLIVVNWQDFELLTGIFTAYTMYGIFLSIMVSHYTHSLATFFRRAFPVCAVIFLAFEAYVIYRQVSVYGLKTSEYFICLLWIFGLLSVIVLLINRPQRNRLIAWLGLALTVLAVLPILGYQGVPVASQTERLRVVLAKNDMIVDGSITTAPASISLADKITITDAATFLMHDQNKSIPKAAWLTEKLDGTASFASIFGFNETYSDYAPGEDVYTEVYLNLPPGSIDISGYSYSLVGIDYNMPQTVTGQLGVYTITFENMDNEGAPAIQVSRDGQIVLNHDLSDWISGLAGKYKGINGKEPPELADMTVELSGSDFRLLVVFQTINIMISTDEGTRTYLYPNSVYLGE